MNNSVIRRLGALVAASSLAITGLTLVAPPAQAAVDLGPQTLAADWLASELRDGILYNPQYDFYDYGASIDTALALDSIGGYADVITEIGNAVRDNYYAYVTGGEWGPEELLGGQMGKALVMAQVAGTSPDVYADRVQADVERQVATVSPIVGRVENRASYDQNVFGQVFVARGLVVAGSDLGAEALAFLLQQQCADGHFRERFSPKDASDQSCDAGAPTTAGDTIGATATAVINLQAIAGQPGVDAAITAAQNWLKLQMNPDGSFGTDGGNANNTGLAAQAIGNSNEAMDAAKWLRDHQADATDQCTKLASSQGAIAFTTESLADGRADGITINTRGEWDRATSQSIVALKYLEAEPDAILELTGPAGFLKAGSVATYQVAGANIGARLCLRTGPAAKVGIASGAGAASIALTLPAGTATRTVLVIDRYGNSDAVYAKVLGAKTLFVKPAIKRVVRGRLVRVTVSGLAAGESVTLRYRGVVKATGKATSAGTFVRYVNVGRTLGSATIAATGQFPTIRKGANTITVIR